MKSNERTVVEHFSAGGRNGDGAAVKGTDDEVDDTCDVFVTPEGKVMEVTAATKPKSIALALGPASEWFRKLVHARRVPAACLIQSLACKQCGVAGHVL